MPSSARQQFGDLVGFVDQLIDIHGRLQQGKGRRHRLEAIHHAGVVMMVAAWESYVEKVLMEALDAIENEAGIAAAGALPVPVPSWAKLAFALRRADIANDVKRFHTPQCGQRSQLADAFVGVRSLAALGVAGKAASMEPKGDACSVGGLGVGSSFGGARLPASQRYSVAERSTRSATPHSDIASGMQEIPRTSGALHRRSNGGASEQSSWHPSALVMRSRLGS